MTEYEDVHVMQDAQDERNQICLNYVTKGPNVIANISRKFYGKVCCQLTGSSDFTLKSLLPVNWQQRFYDEMAAAS